MPENGAAGSDPVAPTPASLTRQVHTTVRIRPALRAFLIARHLATDRYSSRLGRERVTPPLLRQHEVLQLLETSSALG